MGWYFVQLAFMRLWGRMECAKSRNNGVICVIIISYYIRVYQGYFYQK